MFERKEHDVARSLCDTRVKVHSHRARLRPLTDVNALGVNAQAC